MNEFISQKVYKSTGVVANAMQDIDEKVREIKEVEKGINRLFSMIQDLRQTIANQNATVASISENVDAIHDHVEQTHHAMVSAKTKYEAMKEVRLADSVHDCLGDHGHFGNRYQLAAWISGLTIQ